MNMFKNTIIAMVLMCTLLISTASANNNDWPLRGKGEVRYLKMIKVYDARLFSPQAVNADNILKHNVSKCLQLDYAVSLSVDKFRMATNQILNQQYDTNYLNKIKSPLETLQKSYKPVRKGDYYLLCYNANTQKLRLDHNKTRLVEIRSAELAKAYLGIWLSKNKPISGTLFNSFFAKAKQS